MVYSLKGDTKKTRKKLELLEKSKNNVETIQEKDLRVMIDSIPHPKKPRKKFFDDQI